MAPFLASLAHDDLAPATLRGYRYDLRHFLVWGCRHRADAGFTLSGMDREHGLEDTCPT